MEHFALRVLLLLCAHTCLGATPPENDACDIGAYAPNTLDLRYRDVAGTVFRGLAREPFTFTQIKEAAESARKKKGMILFEDPTPANEARWLWLVSLNQSNGRTRAMGIPIEARVESGAGFHLPSREVSGPEAFHTGLALYPREEGHSGSVVPVLTGRGGTELGEVIAVNSEARTATVEVRRPDGTLETREVAITTIGTFAKMLPGPRERPQNMRFSDPTSLPDGTLFPSGSANGGDLLMVHRTADPYLRDLLAEALPRISGPRVFFFAPSRTVMANRVVGILAERLRHAHAVREGDRQRIYLQNVKDRARTERRGRLVGDALYLERGVCKEFAILAAVMLHDSGVPARYVRGHSNGVPHAWIEFQKEDGQWIAMEPQNGQTWDIADYGRKGTAGASYAKPEPTYLEIARY